MQEILTDSIIDCLKLLPFLYLSYLAVEYAEHRMSEKTKIMIYRAGKAGPVIGALIGVIPQCGFAAAAAGLFAGGMLSPGTLLAVFCLLYTSRDQGSHEARRRGKCDDERERADGFRAF